MNFAQKYWIETIVGVALVALIFVPRTLDLALFQGHDETMRNRQSLDSFVALVEGRWGDVYSSNFGATNLTWAQTGYRLFHYVRLRLSGQPVTLTEIAHYGPDFNPLPGALFNATLLLILYPFLRKLLGWPTAALATAILALDPYLLSEARILRTEAAYATFITLTSVCLAIYAYNQRRLYLAWTGFWLAWAIATKVSGVILGPAALLVLIGMQFAPTAPVKLGEKIRRVMAEGLLLGAGTLVSTVIIWPTLWVQPLQTTVEMINYVLYFGVDSKELDFFYLGGIVTELPAAYYGLILLYKTTPLVWLGLGAFAWLAWRSRKTEVAAQWGGLSFPAAGGLIILVCTTVFVVAMAIATFKTERYMMAAVSNLNVIAAIGLVALVQKWRSIWRAQRWPPTAFWASAGIILVVGHGLFAWLNHPYYFSYYNPLLGGGYTAVKIVQIGSGELVDRAVAYLNQQPDPAQQVVVCGTNLPRCEYQAAGQTFLDRNAFNPIYADWVAVDYVVTYIFQAQRGDYPPGVIDYLEQYGQPSHTVAFQGIDYATVYAAPQAQFVSASELTGISTLLGYSLSTQNLAAGDELGVKLYLQNDGQIEHNLLVRLVDADDYTWAETIAQIPPKFQPLIRQRGAILENEATLTLPAGMPPGQYFLKMDYRTAGGELVGQFTLPGHGDTITVALPPQFAGRAQPPQPLNLTIDNALQLTGVNLLPIDNNPAGTPSFWLTLYWHAVAPVERDYVINLRLLNARGEEAAYWLGRPVRSGYPTNQWQAGQVVQDPWRLTPQQTLPPGNYHLELKLFDAETEQPVFQTVLLDNLVLK